MFEVHGRNVYLAAEIKKHVSIPVATIGGLNDPAQMEQILAEGKAVLPEGILCDDAEGREVLIPGKTIICDLGQRSRTDEVNALLDAAPFVRVIGDAGKVGSITNAVYQGYHAALDI